MPNDEHAIFAPSASKRWLTCPGAIGMTRNIPEPPTSEAAAEGIAAHWLFENYKERKTATEDPNGYPINQDILDHVKACLVEIHKQVGPSSSAAVFKEYQLAVWEVLGLKKDVIWGTCDTVILKKHKAWLIDLKYGKWPVRPKNNPQLLTYAVGLLPLIDGVYEELNLVILQPKSSKLWKQYTAPVQEIKDWRDMLIEYFTKRKQREFRSHLQSGQHCYFCLAKRNCPARMGFES